MRPIQHQNADRAVTTFQRILPMPWVFREKNRDYGIDGEVELFDDSGNPLGLSFLVQIKGKQVVSSANRFVSLTWKTYSYLKKLQLPVLIVLCDVSKDVVFARWVSEFDPYYGNRKAKSFSFKFTDSDQWTEGFDEFIAEGLGEMERLNSPKFRGPIEFQLVIAGESLFGLAKGGVATRIGEILSPLGDVVRVGPRVGGPPNYTIELSEDEFRVNLARTKGAVVHIRENSTYPDKLDSIPYDVCFLIGIAFGIAGHPNTGAGYISVSLKYATFVRVPGLAVTACSILWAAGRSEGVLEILDYLVSDDNTIDLANIVANLTLINSSKFSSDEQEKYIDFLNRLKTRALENNAHQFAAAITYNLGIHYRNGRQFRLALRCYRSAAKYDNRYESRGYYWRELGSILMESNRCSAACGCYQRSLDLGASNEVLPLLADALMFHGRFSDAAETFGKFLEEKGDQSMDWTLSEWELKAFLLEVIIQDFHIPDQRRDKRRASAIAGSAIEQTRDDDVEKMLTEAINVDALCGLAWFNLGFTYYKKKDWLRACIGYLGEALIEKWDVEAWCYALLMAMNLSKVSEEGKWLFVNILHEGYFSMGADFLMELEAKLKEQGREGKENEFINMVSNYLAVLPRANNPRLIRLWAPDGQVHLIDI